MYGPLCQLVQLLIGCLSDLRKWRQLHNRPPFDFAQGRLQPPRGKRGDRSGSICRREEKLTPSLSRGRLGRGYSVNLTYTLANMAAGSRGGLDVLRDGQHYLDNS
jgi:hypothetical protein